MLATSATFLGVRNRAWRRVEHLGEAGEDLGIQGISLGQRPDGPRDVAHLARLDHGHRQSGLRQGRHERDVTPTRRFQHDERGTQHPQARDEGAKAGLVVRRHPLCDQRLRTVSFDRRRIGLLGPWVH